MGPSLVHGLSGRSLGSHGSDPATQWCTNSAVNQGAQTLAITLLQTHHVRVDPERHVDVRVTRVAADRARSWPSATRRLMYVWRGTIADDHHIDAPGASLPANTDPARCAPPTAPQPALKPRHRHPDRHPQRPDRQPTALAHATPAPSSRSRAYCTTEVASSDGVVVA